jgi:hypothetical protein
MYQRAPALERPKAPVFEVFVTPKTRQNHAMEPALPETPQKRSFQTNTGG